MVTDSINTISLKLDPAASAKNFGGKLPAVDSVVDIQVLDKNGVDYKILVSGKVFQTVLPLGAEIGEMLLAKVISTNPLALQLNNLFAANLSESFISLLLLKLNINESELSKKLLKGLLESNKPVIRSKFKALLYLLEHSDVNIDELNLGYLTELFWVPENFNELNENTINNFATSIEELTAKIFTSFLQLNQSSADEISVKELNKILLLDLSLTGGYDANAKNITNKDHLLAVWLGNYSRHDSEKIKTLAGLLRQYLYQKEFYERTNLLPEFIIVKHDNNFELVEYQMKKMIDNADSGAVRFKFNLTPKRLGTISINGSLAGSNLNVNFEAYKNTINELNSGKNILSQNMKSKLALNAHVSFSNADLKSTNKDMLFDFSGGVDVKA